MGANVYLKTSFTKISAVPVLNPSTSAQNHQHESPQCSYRPITSDPKFTRYRTHEQYIKPRQSDNKTNLDLDNFSKSIQPTSLTAITPESNQSINTGSIRSSSIPHASSHCPRTLTEKSTYSTPQAQSTSRYTNQVSTHDTHPPSKHLQQTRHKSLRKRK